MKLIVGLGNPGEEYKLTRHNCGFLALNHIADKNKFPEFEKNEKLNSLISKKDKIILARPQTFMNNSGQAVKKIRDFYKIKPENIIVIHDDADLPLGNYKMSFNKNSAGHKGIESVIKSLKTKKFWRFRIGINAKKRIPAEKLVLKKFTKRELTVVENIMEKITEQILV